MSGVDQTLLAEMRKYGLYYAEPSRTQTPAKSRDKNDEGKRRASTTTQPTEKTMNQATVSVPSSNNNGKVDVKSVDFSTMSVEQQIDTASRAAIQAAAQVQQLTSLQHQAIVMGATAATTVALGTGVFFLVRWLTTPSVG